MCDDKNKLYPASYGKWSGFSEGHKPDYSRCCEDVRSGERWIGRRQCNRARGYGPDKAYCKQHNPDAVKEREKAIRVRQVEKWNAERSLIYGPTFLKVLREIAAGHNDARGLAAETVSKFDDGATRMDDS